MKLRRSSKSLVLSVIAGLCLNAIAVPALAAETVDSDGWKFGTQIYLWGPEIEATSTAATDIEISLKDILENLDLVFMGMLAARKGKWTFVADLIYLDLSDKSGFSTPSLGVSGDADVELQNWIVTPEVWYRVLETEKYQVDVVGGLRYVDVDVELNLSLDTPNPGGIQENNDDSFGDWNGIVGAKGRVYLTDNWFVGGYADVGTGDSDITFQLLGRAGYDFDRFELVAGYRYLEWQFDKGDNNLLKDLTVKGPFGGLIYWF